MRLTANVILAPSNLKRLTHPRSTFGEYFSPPQNALLKGTRKSSVIWWPPLTSGALLLPNDLSQHTRVPLCWSDAECLNAPLLPLCPSADQHHRGRSSGQLHTQLCDEIWILPVLQQGNRPRSRHRHRDQRQITGGWHVSL